MNRRGHLHPTLILLAMLLIALALTHLVPAGRFARQAGVIVPGTYRQIAKVDGLPALLATTAPAVTDTPARAAGAVAFFASIPAGMVASASLIFMVMFVGGMFGVLRATGAIDAAAERLLHLTSGNVYLLATGLMVLLACGATFLGFISEYLVIIPLVLELAQRLRLPNMFAPAVVVVASMIGWAASVTNPLALTVVQPLAGVPIFSGLLPRLEIFAAALALGVAYVLLYVRRLPKAECAPEASRLTARQTSVLIALAAGGAALIVGTGLWSWGSPQLAAAFVALALVLAIVGGLRPGFAADAFVKGMQGMLAAGLMFGLASAMEILLRSSQILDTVVQYSATLLQGHTRGMVAEGIMAAQMVFGLLIHSVMPKAIISMPILMPIAQLSGVGGQIMVVALVLGSGLINMVSPTNGVLLAFLAESRVGYFEWFRFIWPLFVVLSALGFIAMYWMTFLGT